MVDRDERSDGDAVVGEKAPTTAEEDSDSAAGTRTTNERRRLMVILLSDAILMASGSDWNDYFCVLFLLFVFVAVHASP